MFAILVSCGLKFVDVMIVFLFFFWGKAERSYTGLSFFGRIAREGGGEVRIQRGDPWCSPNAAKEWTTELASLPINWMDTFQFLWKNSKRLRRRPPLG
ncbi:hypothetical protein JHK86_020650 [Glycine max]|nr:hypothetical protein JHK86_020650 [Glycine max]